MDADLWEKLGQSSARFLASMNRILERYNHPFEDDFLVSMETLTYNTPDGVKKWGNTSTKNVKKWKKEILEHNRRSQRNAEISKQQITDFEAGHSLAHEESSENSSTSSFDTTEESDVEEVSGKRECEDVHLQKPKVNGGKIEAKVKVPVDVIVQDDARNIPRWIEKPKVNYRKTEAKVKVPVDVIVQDDARNIPRWIEKPKVNYRKTEAKVKVPVDVIVQDDARNIPRWIEKPKVNYRETQATIRVPVDVIVQDDARNIPKWIEKPKVNYRETQATIRVPVDVIVQDDARNIPKWIEKPKVNYGETQAKIRVPVDVIVQDDARNIPKWVEVTSEGLSGSLHLTSLAQELISTTKTKSFDCNQAAVCRKKLELSNECYSSTSLQSQYFGDPIPSSTITIPRHRPSPELNRTCCDSIFEEHQSVDGECSRSNVALVDLYPAMVDLFSRLMKKESQRKAQKYLFGHSRFRGYHSRRLKLNATIDIKRGFRHCKFKKSRHNICSSKSEVNRNPTSGNESREFCYDDCLINNSSALVPYTDRNEFGTDYSDSSLEHHLVSGKGQKVSKQTVFPNVMARMGETFLVEDELQTTASPKSSECKESEKCWSGYHFVPPTASSELTAHHLVTESKTQKADSSCDTSELCSFFCRSYGNNNSSAPVTKYSSVRASNTFLMNPEKIISESQNSFQHEHSFSSLFIKQSPSKTSQKYKDAFEELYYKVCSGEYEKSFTLTRPLSNSQNLEENGRLVKRRDFVRSRTDLGREFDRLYEEVCQEPVPKLPGFQRASNLRKYEGVKMSDTVNDFVNSPVQNLPAVARVKRLGDFPHYLSSPVKRVKHIPEHYFSSAKCQEISHRQKLNLQTGGMDFLSTHNSSNPRFFEDHNCQIQHSGFLDSSDKTSFAVPGTSLQEADIADALSGWPKAKENCSSPRKAWSVTQGCTEN
ncbi:Holliday junction recognition protein isoform X3 [Pithys albifrons albifrons]|uniref:Holliday junction recognition protein isoform X3 n=1 Tax=Pithys albifrons albifrons TaxID=3385563 RepID=UPI003A5CDAFB